MTTLTLPAAIADHIAAVNRFDLDAVMATLAPEILVNDVAREFWGTEHVRAWILKEMIGDHVTLEPVEVVDNAGMYAVRCKFDGDYDKTNLPDPLIMTNYFRVVDDKIVTLFIIKNSDPKY